MNNGGPGKPKNDCVKKDREFSFMNLIHTIENLGNSVTDIVILRDIICGEEKSKDSEAQIEPAPNFTNYLDKCSSFILTYYNILNQSLNDINKTLVNRELESSPMNDITENDIKYKSLIQSINDFISHNGELLVNSIKDIYGSDFLVKCDYEDLHIPGELDLDMSLIEFLKYAPNVIINFTDVIYYYIKILKGFIYSEYILREEEEEIKGKSA